MADPALSAIPWPQAPPPGQGALGGLLANPAALLDLVYRLGDRPPDRPSPGLPDASPAPVTSAPLPPRGTSAAPVFSAQDVSDDNPRGIDPAYIDRLKRFEGYRSLAYPDGGQYSIGYGTRASSPYERISQDEAHQRLMSEINAAAGHVDRIGADMSPTQRHALIDLTYNAGPAWTRGSIGQAVRAGDWDKAAELIGRYKTTSNGRPLPGLVNRRGWEASGLRAAGAPASAPPATAAATPAPAAAPATAAPAGDDPWAPLDAAVAEPATAPAAATPKGPADPWAPLDAAVAGEPVRASTGDPWAPLDAAAETPSFADRWGDLPSAPPIGAPKTMTRRGYRDWEDEFLRTHPTAGALIGASHAVPQQATDFVRNHPLGAAAAAGGALTAPYWLPYAWPVARTLLKHPVMGALGGSSALDALGLTHTGVLGGLMDLYEGLQAMGREAKRREQESTIPAESEPAEDLEESDADREKKPHWVGGHWRYR